ncbi:MAG: protein jag [Clostridiales bacterium]|jgi:spoIIIJ-associated protein|nr:protein jag [Clostridiales bacterium]
MNAVEKIGRTLNEAVEAALAELGAARDKVEVQIIEKGSSGILGLIATKPYKVRVTKLFSPEAEAEAFLRKIAEKMGAGVQFEIERKERYMDIEIIGEDASFLIGKHGHTLDAVQYLVNLAVNKGEEQYVNIRLDCGGYRAKRRETLEQLARNLAKKVKMTKRSVTLEPMSSAERRVIHAALQGDKYVSTHSEGDEPHRSVVISLKVRTAQ